MNMNVITTFRKLIAALILIIMIIPVFLYAVVGLLFMVIGLLIELPITFALWLLE